MAEFGDCRPFHSMPAILSSLSTNGQVQSVLSATDQVNLDKMVDHFGFGDYFDFVYGIDNKIAASKLQRGFEIGRESCRERGRNWVRGESLIEEKHV